MSDSLIKGLYEVLLAAKEHLDYCNYGDKYERECADAEGLPKRIDQILIQAREHLGLLAKPPTRITLKHDPVDAMEEIFGIPSCPRDPEDCSEWDYVAIDDPWDDDPYKWGPRD